MSVINTNIGSMTAQRNLATNQASLATSMQRLSSGLRINSAKDDAAGMAIASRMSSQINGQNQAARNANDAISLTQTAEGGLATATDLLQRMRDLSVQSANSTNSNADRASMQAEVTQLKSELDRVANTTSFNGIKLLDGSFTAQTFQVGANSSAADKVQIASIGNLKASSLGLGGTGGASLASGMTSVKLTAGDLVLSGVQVGASDSASILDGAQAGQTADSAWAIAKTINAVSAQSGVTASANTTYASSTTVAPTSAATAVAAVAAGSFSINGVNVGAIEAGIKSADTGAAATTAIVAQGANVAAAINKITDQTGVIATAAKDGKVTLSSINSGSITVAVKGTYTDTLLTANTGLAPSATTAATAPTTSGAITANDLTINGVGISALGGGSIAAGTTMAAQGANVANAINLATGQTGVTAAADAVTGAITLAAADGRNIVVAFAGATADAAHTGLAAATTRGTVSLTSSNPAGIVVGGAKTDSAGLADFLGQAVTSDMTNGSALGSLDISTAAGANRALTTIDNALSSVNAARGAMGAYQNRFTSVVSNLQSTAENLTASRSRIQDADFAAETASLSRSQVLQQAGTAMVAQANQLPQGVLALLR